MRNCIEAVERPVWQQTTADFVAHEEFTRDIQNVNNYYDYEYDNIETQIRCLEHLRVKVDVYGAMLVPISKIPQEINLIISRQLQETVPNWTVGRL